MSIQEKIKEIAVYFRKKLITGDYEFIECSEYRATIKIEGYNIDLWIGNKIKDHLSIYPSDTILNNDIIFRGEDDRIKVWDSLEPYVKEFRKKENLKKLREIKNEIEELL